MIVDGNKGRLGNCRSQTPLARNANEVHANEVRGPGTWKPRGMETKALT
jgi:hypothetical protein